jgi:hypothetical protein
MHALFKQALLTLLLLLSTALGLPAQQMFVVRDISPDGKNFTGPSNASDPGGRIKSLIVDPNNDKILYAASEFAGVWKSKTGAVWISGSNAHTTAPTMKWFQASNGLRSGLTVNNTSLAIDKSNSKRLLYATGDNDGRPAQALGGLWVSVDAAGTWTHQSPCPTLPTGVVSVAFDNGQPYVSANCGIATTAQSNLASGWKVLPTGPTSPPVGSLVVDGGFGTLFACSGNQVYRATDAGASGVWNVLTLPGGCFHLTAVPNGNIASTTAVVIWSQLNNQEVSTVNFANNAVTGLSFFSRPSQPAPTSGYPGSGQPAVAAPPITSPPGTPSAPGITYDVYAADSCAWYAYNPGTATWAMLGSNGTECNGNTTLLHADTWAMAFPSWYDTTTGFCAAYAATDGGVFFSGGQLSAPVVGGCINNWGLVQNGLHVLESEGMFAITAGSKPFTSSLTEGVYLPTGDNDVFVTTFGWASWQNFNALGDAGQASVDVAFPNQVIVARNNNYTAIYPPDIGGTYTNIVPPLPKPAQFDVGITIAGVSNLAQVMTTKPEFPSPPNRADYLAVWDTDSVNCGTSQFDLVVRSRLNPPGPGTWLDVSPADHFLACDIAKIQAGGGHANGSLNIYVLTGLRNSSSNPPVNYSSGRGPGQIYRGVFNGAVPNWTSASGSSANPLGVADNFYVNPYDPTELYAVSVANQAIEVSRDSGATWTTDTVLTDIATNHGEYSIGCHGSRGTGSASSPFTNACSLSGMAFDVFAPKVRVAAMLYGGIAFSRDHGKHWMALDLTDNNHLVSNNLTQMVASCFFDGETHGTGTKPPPIPGPDQHIYAALEGQSLRSILGPFKNLESLNFTYKPTSNAVHVVVNIFNASLHQTIPLYRDSAGAFHGSLLFDWKLAPSVKYQYVVDGVAIAPEIHTLSVSETTDGVASASP